MIDHEHKFIFIHIPKTGGTSIEQFFKPDILPDVRNYDCFYGWDKKHKFWRQHATMQQINDLYEKDLTGYFKFGFVRNPWSRALSDFIWMTEVHTPFIKGSFVDYLLLRNNFKRIMIKQRRKYRMDHIIPQSDFLFDADGNLLVDFIGRFENLQEDFNTICDKIGIPRQKLPHKNKSKHKHYTEYYDDETRSIVAEKYAKDIEYFGYKFGE